jgi:endonuclease YncB( thermonuclease family)
MPTIRQLLWNFMCRFLLSIPIAIVFPMTFALFPSLGHAERPSGYVLHGHVVRVIDGDTLVMLDDSGERHTLRLAGIDAPEKGMPYGLSSKNTLITWLDGEEVTAQIAKNDRYGRKIATVVHQGRDINLALLKAGLAWHYKRYAREQTPEHADSYGNAELLAKGEQRGLWQEPEPIPPWLWRQYCRKAVVCDYFMLDATMLQKY